MTGIGEVLDFWLTEVGEKSWYVAVPELDTKIADRFMPTWQEAWEGRLDDWLDTADGALAFLIVTDQFPRNMFRDNGLAFATDAHARRAARLSIARNFDLTVPEPQRAFFYMPFEHSEDPADQDWAVALTESRLVATRAGFAHHARLHREVIRRYGRFPFRNAALGRTSTSEEEAFLASGGYGAIVREFAGV